MPQAFNRSPQSFKKLNLDDFPQAMITTGWVHVINNGIGEPIRIPVMVAKGRYPGKVLGLTAAVHGNELNGVKVIQEIFEALNPLELTGTIVGVLAVNIPGLLKGERSFNNGIDLNKIAPGKANGNESDVFMHRFFERVISCFDFLIDLHTASFGRVNSFYIRADMQDQVTEKMATLQDADIILKNQASDSTLRGACAQNGIKAITLELRDPGIFQDDVIQGAILGIKNVLYDFGFLPGSVSGPIRQTMICKSSFWLYTDEGGILVVHAGLKELVQKGQKIAEVKSIFGETIKEYLAPQSGIVIGRSINPINQTGSRILHLGLEPLDLRLAK